MISDQELLNIYYNPTLSVREVLEILKTKHNVHNNGKPLKEDTLVRHIKKIGAKTRKELGIRKNKFGHIPNCNGCDYKVTECVCDDIKKGRIAHG
jgi:hypothetical protein